jgi:hypothetical protein
MHGTLCKIPPATVTSSNKSQRVFIATTKLLMLSKDVIAGYSEYHIKSYTLQTILINCIRLNQVVHIVITGLWRVNNDKLSKRTHTGAAVNSDRNNEALKKLRNIFRGFVLTCNRFSYDTTMRGLIWRHKRLYRSAALVSLSWITHHTAQTCLHMTSTSSHNWGNTWEDVTRCQPMKSTQRWWFGKIVLLNFVHRLMFEKNTRFSKQIQFPKHCEHSENVFF